MGKEKKPSELGAQSASVNGVVGDTSQTHYSITLDEMQSLYGEVNGDKDNKKLKNKSWAKKKSSSELLRSSYFRISMTYKKLSDAGYSPKEIEEQFGILPSLGQRGLLVGTCGDVLQFRKPISGGKWKLHKASFCHDRLCPICTWRRSLKIYTQLNQIMNHLQPANYEYLFLTVTVPNCEGSVLESVCDRILKSFTKMMRRKELKSLVKGYFRSLEVTFNHNSWSKSFMTFHPHLHAILAVPKSYFKKSYIKQEDWLRMWREAYGDDSIEFVNIKKVYASVSEEEKYKASDEVSVALRKAIAEVGKYTVKSSDYLFAKDPVMTDHAVKWLAKALRSKKLFAMGGIFAEAAKALSLEDVMSSSSDLLHINADDVINPELAYFVVRFKWGGSLYQAASFSVIDPLRSDSVPGEQIG